MTDTINVPRELLADFIEYSVPGPYGCDDKWLSDKQKLVAILQAPAQPAQVQGWRMVPDSLQKLGKRLAELLDEDQFAECEALLLAAAPKPPVQGMTEVVAGALFDFGAFLTTRPEVVEVGAAANSSPMVDLVKEFSELRGLSLNGVNVSSWSGLIAPQPSDDVAISKMARILSDRHAEQCNVDKGDNWKIYGQDYIDDVLAMLEGSKGK